MGLALLHYPTKDNVLPDIDVGNFGWLSYIIPRKGVDVSGVKSK